MRSNIDMVQYKIKPRIILMVMICAVFSRSLATSVESSYTLVESSDSEGEDYILAELDKKDDPKNYEPGARRVVKEKFILIDDVPVMDLDGKPRGEFFLDRSKLRYHLGPATTDPNNAEDPIVSGLRNKHRAVSNPSVAYLVIETSKMADKDDLKDFDKKMQPEGHPIEPQIAAIRKLLTSEPKIIKKIWRDSSRRPKSSKEKKACENPLPRESDPKALIFRIPDACGKNKEAFLDIRSRTARFFAKQSKFDRWLDGCVGLLRFLKLANPILRAIKVIVKPSGEEHIVSVDTKASLYGALWSKPEFTGRRYNLKTVDNRSIPCGQSLADLKLKEPVVVELTEVDKPHVQVFIENPIIQTLIHQVEPDTYQKIRDTRRWVNHYDFQWLENLLIHISDALDPAFLELRRHKYEDAVLTPEEKTLLGWKLESHTVLSEEEALRTGEKEIFKFKQDLGVILSQEERIKQWTDYWKLDSDWSEVQLLGTRRKLLELKDILPTIYRPGKDLAESISEINAYLRSTEGVIPSNFTYLKSVLNLFMDYMRSIKDFEDLFNPELDSRPTALTARLREWGCGKGMEDLLEDFRLRIPYELQTGGAGEAVLPSGFTTWEQVCGELNQSLKEKLFSRKLGQIKIGPKYLKDLLLPFYEHTPRSPGFIELTCYWPEDQHAQESSTGSAKKSLNKRIRRRAQANANR